jgi:hypothetical protein
MSAHAAELNDLQRSMSRVEIQHQKSGRMVFDQPFRCRKSRGVLHLEPGPQCYRDQSADSDGIADE